jgi:hypothetical protein
MKGAGFGWSSKTPDEFSAWDWEIARVADEGGEPRRELFPSQFAAEVPVPVPTWKAVSAVIAAGGNASGGLYVTDPVEKPACPILAKVLEKIGEERYNLWIGPDTEYKDGVFLVRNKFAVNSIRKHFKAEIKSVLLECGIERDPEFVIHPSRTKAVEAQTQKLVMLTAEELSAVRNFKSHELSSALAAINAEQPEKYDAVLAALTPLQRRCLDNLTKSNARVALTH